jgi:hypothetical protein
MARFELLGSDGDEKRLLRAPDVGYSLLLAGHPRVIEVEPDGAKYDVRIALADLPVEHGLRFSEMPDQMNPQALATSLATAYRNTRAISPTDGTVEPLPDAGMVDGVIGGAHILYARTNSDPIQMEYVWVAIHRAPKSFQVLYHTVRFRTVDVTMLAWEQLRASFIDKHTWGARGNVNPVVRSERSIMNERSSDPGFRARFRYGNPHAPFGIGAYTVTVGVDDNVELVHECGGKRRRWIAHAEPALATTLVAGLKSASFPAPPSEKVGRPGTSDFELEVSRQDGTIERVSGFPSPNYRDVSFMFTHIVSQMSGDEVLGFSLPVETRYVSDSKELQ